MRRTVQTTFALRTEKARAFTCPECGVRDDGVIDSRHVDTRIRRRRKCINGHRFTTYELTVDALKDLEHRLQEFHEWQATTRDLLRP